MSFGDCLESESINDIVFDITGADIASFSKEIVKPELCERSVSAMTGALTEVSECRLQFDCILSSYFRKI